MKSLTSLSFLLGLTLSVGFAAAGEDQSLIADGPKAGWQIFGYGVLDSGGDMDAKEIVIDVNWAQAAWGVGSMFKSQEPIKGKKLEGIKFEAKTDNGSKARAFGGVATSDDANLVFSIAKGIELSNSFQDILLPVSQMRKDKPDVTSRMFTDNDWDKIQHFKILFGKPLSAGPEEDRIIVRNPRLIFK